MAKHIYFFFDVEKKRQDNININIYNIVTYIPKYL